MASCPNCGFDLNDTGACPVCGNDGSTKAKTPSRRRRRRGLIIAGGALIAAVGIAGALLGSGVLVRAPAGAAASRAAATAASRATAGGLAAAQAEDPPPPAAVAAVDPPPYDLVERSDYPPIDSKAAYIKWMLARTKESEGFLAAKWERSRVAIGRGDVTSKRVLMAFLLTPRERFVAHGDEPKAYADAAIPIGYGQTISGPHIVIRMTNAINPQPNQRVLEVGTGSGYQSAILSQLTNNVYTIEIVRPLYERTDSLYEKMEPEFPMYANIRRRNADGYFGWPADAPFDRIIVTAAIDHIPPELLRELSPGGSMVIPIGPPSGQTVLKITKAVESDGTVRLTREDIYHGRAKKVFVPFTATGGGVHSLATDTEEGS